MKTDLGNVSEAAARWTKIPVVLLALGGVGAGLGVALDPRQLGFSYLLAFMFFLSLSLGGLFFVIVHHLFDANWSVSLRRVAEHLACLSAVLAVLYVPLALLAPHLYEWMDPASADEVLKAKAGYLNKPFFYLRAVFFFAVWIFLSWRLRYWSLQQDETGAAECTHRMRRLAAGGVFLFAITLTLAAIDWMMALQHHWFSTMYGVYYFAGSVWVTMATLYLIGAWLRRVGSLKELIQARQMKDVGVLMLVFTVFYAYIHFSQYLIIWNANLPEETFWYVVREKGWWWPVSLTLVFGHFLLPFLLLLRIDFKLKLTLMLPLCVWAWLMHFVDISFNVLPPLQQAQSNLGAFPWHWTNLACFAFVGGALGLAFLRSLARHPAYPLKDPRLKEALTVHEVPPPAIAEAVHSDTGMS
jgi:hypothetical protein